MSPTATQPLVYFFGQGRADGSAAMKDILGGKGAALAEMTSIGVSVPPGFTIASTLCQTYLQTRAFPGGLRAQVEACLNRLEAATRRQFGGATKPLLVSVRSGAALSMPGMMETILNLGLNDATVVALERESGNPQFAWDSYRRFVQMYAAVVYSVPKERFETLLAERKRAQSVTRDIDLPVDDLKALVGEFKGLIERETGHGFPDDPMDQLWGAIAAVFESWNTKRAIDYRTLHDIPDSLGTAVNVMTMVFGNLVVSGTRDPQPIAALAETLPEAHAELVQMAKRLERHFRDVQDMEFTIERGTLYMLQTRRAQRTGHAAVRVACDMVHEGSISEEEAVARIPPNDLDQLLHPTIDPSADLDLLTTGLPASPGAASGTVGLRCGCRGADRPNG
jgi:pyruvate,orthophosphate dikinase